VRLELARVYNNLAGLADRSSRLEEARGLFEAAVRLDEKLISEDPANREYMLELAKYCNNLSYLLRRLGEDGPAEARSRQALDLLDKLALPAPSLGVEQADAHNLRGQLLETRDVRAAVAEYDAALGIFQRLSQSAARYSQSFDERYGDLLLSLARLGRVSPDAAVHALLVRAVTSYVDVARRSLSAGFAADAQRTAEYVSNLMPALSESDRAAVAKSYQGLQDELAARR
jgi:tetratricopeptide (TPR) repeat protein